MQQTLKPALLASWITACKPPWVNFSSFEISELSLDLLHGESYCYAPLWINMGPRKYMHIPTLFCTPYGVLTTLLTFGKLCNLRTSGFFNQQNGIIIDELQRMCWDQHMSAHCTLTAVAANCGNSIDGTFISVGIITHSSNSGTILHFFPLALWSGVSHWG